MRAETNYQGVFDRPLADYELVFAPLLRGRRFRDLLPCYPEGKPLVLDLMTSGYNLAELADVANSLAVGLQLSRNMTVAELFSHGVTYLHTDLKEVGAWEEIDGWLKEIGADNGVGRLFLALARPEGAFYDLFWDFDHFWNLLVLPTLERLAPGGYLFFQTPYRVLIGEGRMGVLSEDAHCWRLNTTHRVDEVERLETLVFGLNGCGFEARVAVANVNPTPRPYFDLLMMAKRRLGNDKRFGEGDLFSVGETRVAGNFEDEG